MHKGSYFSHPDHQSYGGFGEHAVVVFVERGDEVLLIVKKRGLGAGKVNGPGGKLEPGESYEEAAIRETREEVGIELLDLEHRVNLGFYFADGYTLYGRVFFSSRFKGELQETDEALPFWCKREAIPYDRMWADDRLWLPRALEGTCLEGIFHFDGDAMTRARYVELSGPLSS